ncbi:T9SS type A sorting domain-containing protein [Candidatus Marinimicrobia bacterium]|nr:T9SS type A sorting domain-containing protein [Candidatus Neomarinimicrobiota bacterium]
MKKKNLKLIVACSMFLVSGLFAKELVPSNTSTKSTMRVMENQSPGISVLNINNMAYWIGKDGAYTTAGSPNGTMADYPIFTGGFIYADGMLWGAKVKGDGLGDEVRVGGSTYNHGMKAGRILTDASGNVLGSDDPANNHVWRVRTDWATADLAVDAANYYGVAVADVTPAQVAVVKGQYEYDWMNWPAAWGAPYNDVDGNGSYNSATDIPGYPGADQTMWTVANDVPLIVNEAGDSTGFLSTAPNLYGSDPIGIELQITMWGYAFGASDPLGNNIFKEAKMKYMGLPALDSTQVGVSGFTGTGDGAILDSLYFTQWSDPDLGTYTDDYVGSDVDLSFGYVYNGNRLDGVFNGIFNLPVPAGGYDFLQGPADNMDLDGDGDSTEFLGMTSFAYFGAGSAIDDPDLSSYEGTLQWFNLMEGFLPRPAYPTQIPFSDPSTGLETKYALSGDPTSGAGWIDGVQLPPGDRRMVMNTGPFQLKVGEEATVVLGIAGGMGLDNVSSVSVAKFHDQYGQYAYDQGFNLPSAPSSPSVSTIEMDGMVGLDWGSSATSVSNTEESISAGFEFEGYVVYQLPSASSPLSEAVKVATYDKVNLIQNILDPSIDPTTGLVVDAPKQTGTDIGVQRFFETDYDEVRGRPMSNGITYHFAVTAYSYLSDNDGSPFKTLESGETRVAVTPRTSNPGETVFSEMSSDIEVTHNGTANASVGVTVLNPSALKDESYKVSFDTQVFARDLAGKWNKVVAGRVAGKASDCTGSTVSATALASATVGTIDLKLAFTMNCGNNWVDGIGFTFPANMGTINSWETTGPGNVCGSGADEGQNCVNLDGTLDGNSLLFGTVNAQSEFGAYESSNLFTINYTPAGDFAPVTVGFTIYDDNYDGTEVNAVGDAVAAELNYETKTEYHWNLSTASGTVLLEDQTFLGGADLYGGASVDSNSFLHYNTAAAVTIDGFQVNVEGGYDSPTDFFGYDITRDAANAALYGASSWDMTSYMQQGWGLTAKATDTYGNGLTSVDYLQRDIEVRWVGEFVDEPTTTDAGVVYYGANTALPHSYVWLDESRVGALKDHPDAGNPGDGTPFRVAVPFEVWDIEHPDGPQQIDMFITDRLQSYDSGDTVYVFNPFDRMYTHFLQHAYQEDGLYEDGPTGIPSDWLTWNVVWWDAQFNQGDVVKFKYANPIQAGVDEFSFTTKASMTAASNDVSEVSVYPNPYYGTHELEGSRADKYVSFNHLPVEAKIDIYSLGGVFVRSIDKSDATQFAEWDLKNQYGYPVASGMYVARIKSGGEEKILKIALVQETQVLKYY